MQHRSFRDLAPGRTAASLCSIALPPGKGIASSSGSFTRSLFHDLGIATPFCQDSFFALLVVGSSIAQLVSLIETSRDASREIGKCRKQFRPCLCRSAGSFLVRWCRVCFCSPKTTADPCSLSVLWLGAVSVSPTLLTDPGLALSAVISTAGVLYSSD